MTNLVGVGPPLWSTAKQRFIRPFVSGVYWFSAVADLAFPTVAEVNSAINLAPMLTGTTGFSIERARVPYDDVQLLATIQRPAPSVSFADSALSFYDDRVDATIRSYLAPGMQGWVGRMPYGRVAGKRMELWPATTMEPIDGEWSLDPQVATFEIPVAITGIPELDATVPG